MMFVYDVMTEEEYATFGLVDWAAQVEEREAECCAYDVDKKWVIDRENMALLVRFDEADKYILFWKGERIIFSALRKHIVDNVRQTKNERNFYYKVSNYRVPPSLKWQENSLKNLIDDGLYAYEQRKYLPIFKKSPH